MYVCIYIYIYIYIYISAYILYQHNTSIVVQYLLMEHLGYTEMLYIAIARKCGGVKVWQICSFCAIGEKI